MMGGSVNDKKVWAEELCKTLGNPNPSANTIQFVQAWEIQESGSGNVVGCENNPLNTCQETIGSKPCNAGHGCVQAYGDYANQYVGKGGGEAEGLHATAQALSNGLYPSLVHALRTNDENNLGFNGHTLAPNIASDLSVWSTGTRTPVNMAYVDAILKLAGEKNLPSGGDLGQVNPNANPLNSGAIDWNRIARAGIGTILLLVGMSLLIKTVTPAPIASAIKNFAK